MKARDLLEAATATSAAEAESSFDTEEFRRGIQTELQTTDDMETAKERAYARLMSDPNHYRRHREVRSRFGLPEDPEIVRRGKMKTTQRLRAVEAKADKLLKPAPKGEFDPFEVAVGTEVEKEHTTSTKAATTIAKQHIGAEGGKHYYTKKLKTIEPEEVGGIITKLKKKPLWRGKGTMSLMTLPISTSTPSGPPGA